MQALDAGPCIARARTSPRFGVAGPFEISCPWCTGSSHSPELQLPLPNRHTPAPPPQRPHLGQLAMCSLALILELKESRPDGEMYSLSVFVLPVSSTLVLTSTVQPGGIPSSSQGIRRRADEDEADDDDDEEEEADDEHALLMGGGG